jgi:hypothetical protein
MFASTNRWVERDRTQCHAPSGITQSGETPSWGVATLQALRWSTFAGMHPKSHRMTQERSRYVRIDEAGSLGLPVRVGT